MKRIIDLPAEFEHSEGLDGYWDIDDLSADEKTALDILFDENADRDIALGALLSIIGSRCDDAELTSLKASNLEV